MKGTPPIFDLGVKEVVTLRWTLVCALIAGLSSVLLLALSGWFLTAAAVAGAGSSAAVLAFNYLLPSAAIRGLAIARTGGRYGERLLGHRAALLGIATLRSRLFGKLAGQDSRDVDDLSGGDASARLISDIAALEDLIIRRPTRPASLLAAILAVGLTSLAGWKAALALALLVAILPLLLGVMARRITAKPAGAAAEALGELRSRFVEFVAARPEIIAYGLGDRVLNELSLPSDQLDLAGAQLFRGEGLIAGLLLAYGAASAALVLALAHGPAARIAFALLAAAASIEAMSAFARTALRQASVEESLARLADLMDLPDRAVSNDSAQAVAAPLTIGLLDLEPGSRVAVTGVSGSGKTRLIEALAGVRPTVHAITVGGIAVSNLSSDDLRRQFALSPQDAPLIAGTIADNLRLARVRLTDDEMHRALKIACLDTRIRSMPAGLQTILGEDGGTLSGGERKRLSLARALLAGRPWLLLDEPTEGLDAATETELILRLDAWLEKSETGLVLVSHRPAPLLLVTRQIPIDEVGVAT